MLMVNCHISLILSLAEFLRVLIVLIVFYWLLSFGLKAQIKQKTPIYDLPNCYFERFYVHFRFKAIENSQNWGLWEKRARLIIGQVSCD